MLPHGRGRLFWIDLPRHRRIEPRAHGPSSLLFHGPLRPHFPELTAPHTDAAFFSIGSSPPGSILRMTDQCDIHTIGGCPPRCLPMRACGDRTTGHSMQPQRQWTRSFSTRCWVRSRRSIHRGRDERALGRGSGCGPAQTGLRGSLNGRDDGRRSRNHKCATGITRQGRTARHTTRGDDARVSGRRG